MDIDTIATHAHSIKKPSKLEAFDAVVNMIDHAPTEEDIAFLYAFFLPPPTAKPKTDLAWIMKALAPKSELRKYLQFAWSDGKRLAATDGHRMHILNGTDLPEGYYDSAGNPVTLDLMKFPDIDRVIPTTGEVGVITVNEIKTLPVKSIYHVSSIDSAAVKISEDHFNRRYVMDAISGFSHPTIDILMPGIGKAISITRGNLSAVIMPVRV